MSDGIHASKIEKVAEEAIIDKIENKKPTFGDEVHEDSALEVPPSLYEGKFKVPMIADDFGIKAPSQDDMQKLKAIDQYILDKIKDGYEDTQDSYSEILDDLMRMLGLSENDLNKVDKLYQAVILRRFLNVGNNR